MPPVIGPPILRARGDLPPVKLTWYDGGKKPSLVGTRGIPADQPPISPGLDTVRQPADHDFTQMQCMHCRQSHCDPPIRGGVADIRSGLDLTAGGRISNILALLEPEFRPRGIIHGHSAVERVDRCCSTAT